jgi:hypothetical protein
MGAVIFFVFIFLCLLLIAGIPIITVNLIHLVKNARKIKSGKQYNKTTFGFAILGTIIGFCFISFPVLLLLYIRSADSTQYDEYIDTGIKIDWEEDNDGRYFFILNNRRYERFNIYNAFHSGGIEVDRAIANIEWEDKNWFNILIGEKYVKATIYTIKNCPDYSILTTDGFSSQYHTLYCDIEYLEDKNNYYANMENYTLYFSLGKQSNVNECQPIHNAKLSIVDELYNYKGIETDLGNFYYNETGADIDEHDYNYISIFGISNDKIFRKDIMTIIIDGFNFYREEKWASYTVITPSPNIKIHVTILDGLQKALLLGLIE